MYPDCFFYYWEYSSVIYQKLKIEILEVSMKIKNILQNNLFCLHRRIDNDRRLSTQFLPIFSDRFERLEKMKWFLKW